MVVDQNCHRVKKYFLLIILSILFSSKSFSENYKLKKIINLDDPWGSAFISNQEIIVTEKKGKIKIINIISKKIFEIKHNLNLNREYLKYKLN